MGKKIGEESETERKKSGERNHTHWELAELVLKKSDTCLVFVL